MKHKDGNSFQLRGIAGYVYGVDELNKVCSIFGSGYGATKSRSVNVDDINRITGYNPNNEGKYDPKQTGSGYKYNKDNPGEYGSKMTYVWEDVQNKVEVKKGNIVINDNESENYAQHGFNWYDIESKTWKSLMQDITKPIEITTLASNGYAYYSNTLNLMRMASGETEEGLKENSEEYKTLFKNKDGEGDSYWLASSFIEADEEGKFGIGVASGEIIGTVSSWPLYKADGEVATVGKRIRPVVSLSSEINLQKNEDGSYDIVKEK